MEDVARYAASQAAGLSEHPLIGWLADAPVPATKRLAVVPVLAAFTRAFRDYCLWNLPYPSPQGPLQTAVNARAAANARHCDLLTEDWDALGLRRDPGWGAGDLLWWLFLAPQTAGARQAAMQIPALAAADHGDPALRYMWISALDECLDVLLRAAAPVARAASGENGVRYPYLEEGRLPVSAQLSGEASAELARAVRSGGGLAAAPALADAAVRTAWILFDSLHEYATAYVQSGRMPSRPPATTVADVHQAWPLPPRAPRQARVANGEIEALLYQQRGQIADHPLWRWLASPAGPRPADRLSVLLPDWALGILGVRDVFAYVLPLPGDPAARDLNAWSLDLSRLGGSFMDTWDALGAEAHLGWSASQMLRWLTVDARMEEHRRGLARVAQFAASCTTPLARMWLLEVLGAACPARAPVVMDTARAAEVDLGVPLDYLTGRCQAAAPAGGEFRRHPLSLADAQQVSGMITVLFSGLRRQLDLSTPHAQQRAARMPRPVPPRPGRSTPC